VLSLPEILTDNSPLLLEPVSKSFRPISLLLIFQCERPTLGMQNHFKKRIHLLRFLVRFLSKLSHNFVYLLYLCLSLDISYKYVSKLKNKDVA